jgi:hypothetical protein
MIEEKDMAELLPKLLNEEREACAQLAERLEFSTPDEIAFAIRLRKNSR